MPASGPSTWLPTIEHFINHWGEIDKSRVTPLVLSDKMTLKELIKRRAALETAMQLLAQLGHEHSFAVATLDQLRPIANEKLNTFNRKVRADLAASTYPSQLPLVPSKKASRADYEKAMDNAASLWEKINAVQPDGLKGPLILREGYSKAQFDLLNQQLKNGFKTEAAASQSRSLQIENRDLLFKGIYPSLMLYRKAVIADFAPENPLVVSLPALRTVRGATPNAVEVKGEWDPEKTGARIEWSPSENPNLDHYSVRVCLGPKYLGANEQAVGSAQPGTREFFTTQGFSGQGSKATFKVYAVLKSGNEKGSNAVTITKP